MKLKVFYGLMLMVIFATGCFVPRSKRIKVGTPSNGQVAEAFVMSYNVENLFDTINDPENDDDFTPTGKLNWNTKKYNEKVDHIAQVIHSVYQEKNNQWPMAIGLIEVEHESCLNDLSKKMLSNGVKYAVAFIEGEDERGIDVGLLYREDIVKSAVVKSHKIVLPDGDKTRHILEMKGIVNGTDIVFYVNHWPSRSGGTEKSEPLRMLASEVLKQTIADQINANPDVTIIAMGDFNDHPSDKSLLNLNSINGKSFFNVMSLPNLNMRGSHFYKGEWGFLDQFVLSGYVISNQDFGWRFLQTEVVDYSYLMYTNNKGEISPARTYVGDSYKGGYSDHLPILLELQYLKQ